MSFMAQFLKLQDKRMVLINPKFQNQQQQPTAGEGEGEGEE